MLHVKTSSSDEARRILKKMRQSGDYRLNLRPGPECRREAVELLALSCKSEVRNIYQDALSVDRELIYAKLLKIASDTSSGHDEGVGPINCDILAYMLFGEASNDALTKGTIDLEKVECAMAWGLRAAFVHTQLCLRYGWKSATASTILYLHGFLLSTGHVIQADWITRFIFNGYASGSTQFELFAAEKDFSEFYWRMVVALVDGQWPTPEKLQSDNLGAYGPLLRAVSEPQSFEKELLIYLDHRVARAYMFPLCGATSKDQRDVSYMPSSPLYGLYPFELLTLKAVVKQTLSIDLSINVDHPLLQSALVKSPPRVSLNYEDEMTRLFDANCRRTFGPDWKLEGQFDLLEA